LVIEILLKSILYNAAKIYSVYVQGRVWQSCNHVVSLDGTTPISLDHLRWWTSFRLIGNHEQQCVQVYI